MPPIILFLQEEITTCLFATLISIIAHRGSFSTSSNPPISFTAIYGDGKLSVRQSALLFQAQMTHMQGSGSYQNRTAAAGGGGLLVATGLNLMTNQFASGRVGEQQYPEAAWLLFSMMRALVSASSLPQAKATIEVKAVSACKNCVPPSTVVWLRGGGGSSSSSSVLEREGERRRSAWNGTQEGVLLRVAAENSRVSLSESSQTSEARREGEEWQQTVVV